MFEKHIVYRQRLASAKEVARALYVNLTRAESSRNYSRKKEKKIIKVAS